MADRFIGALKALEKRSLDNVMIFSDVLKERLDQLAQAMLQEEMSDNDYMKFLELYYQRYRQEKNRKAMMFCVLRIEQLAALKKQKNKQQEFCHLHFSKEMDIQTMVFIKERKPFYQRLITAYQKQSLWFSLLTSLCVFSVFVLGFKLSFFMGLFISLCELCIVFLICNQILIDRRIEHVIHSYRMHADTYCKTIDAFLFEKVEKRNRYAVKRST